MSIEMAEDTTHFRTYRSVQTYRDW